MSYEIYKSVKQNLDGSFQCISSANNTYPLDFHEWTMDYFNKEFSLSTNEEKKALWAIISNYWGDRFYQSNWKDLQRLATQFYHERGYTYDDIHADKVKWLEHAREFLIWKKDRAKTKMKKYIVSMIFSCGGRNWIAKKTSRRVFGTSYEDCAKIFKAHSEEEVRKLFSGYSDEHDIQIKEV